jgi:hypothetical protein
MPTAQDKVFNVLADDLATGGPGVTLDEFSDRTGLSYTQVRYVIATLREVFGESEKVNLVAHRPEGRGQWRYQFVGSLEEAKSWTRSRTTDAIGRMRTLRNITASIMRGEPDDRERLIAEIMHKGTTRIIEDLRDLTRYLDIDDEIKV